MSRCRCFPALAAFALLSVGLRLRWDTVEDRIVFVRNARSGRTGTVFRRHGGAVPVDWSSPDGP